jgi:hypothetical protein
MKTKNLEFQISQLRQDKIIYAVEAAAINITCLVFSSFSSLIINILPAMGNVLFYLNIAIFAYAIGYTLYALFGNLSRLNKIKKLESKL